LSTGMNDINNITKAVKIIENENIPYAVLHCSSIYPTPFEKVRLGALKQLKKRFPNAVIGLSGGKDSTYVLCKIVKKHKLKVLAVTFNNGFLTEFAKKSIENTVCKLGVDHIYYKPDWNIHKKFNEITQIECELPSTP